MATGARMAAADSGLSDAAARPPSKRGGVRLLCWLAQTIAAHYVVSVATARTQIRGRADQTRVLLRNAKG